MKTNIKKWIFFRKITAFFALLVLVLLSVSGLLLAQAVTQGFKADDSLQRGMIVRISESDTTKVETLNQSAAKQIYGVVIDPNDSPVTLSGEGQKVFIATTGQYDVLVSGQNGSIKKGEYITISSVSGIGMKCDEFQLVVIGRALEDFNVNKDIIGTIDVAGQKTNIGRVRTDITVTKNPLLQDNIKIPEFFRNTAKVIADKPVSPFRIYASFIIFTITSAMAIVVLYIGVRSCIISIGRNPLSKKSVIKAMVQIVIIGMFIFLCGVLAVYLLLKV